MIFGSDNFAGAHPAIAANLAKHSAGYATPYGASDLDASVERQLGEIFEHEVAVFYVATGTASNSLALTTTAKPGGIVLAHREAHCAVDECGAPEYLTGQLRVTPVDGPDGKMDLAELRRHAKRIAGLGFHGGRLTAISVTQPTERGTLYTLEELEEISAIASEHQVPVHMDGARFANGLVSLGCSPAEMTWKRGVDILSFGATKNGCWCAEALIFFDPAKARDFKFLQKRSAQLFSKARFVSAQLEAYLANGLWLNLARHANAMATKLAEEFSRSTSMRLISQPEANEIFVIIKKTTIAQLQAEGAAFFAGWAPFPSHPVADDEQLCRFVTSFATKPEDITRFSSIVKSSEKNAIMAKL